VNLGKFIGFYKVAYWVKSGPFVAENRSWPNRGPAPNISWQFWGKTNSFNFWLKSLVSVNLCKFMGFYKVAYRVKSGPFLAKHRSWPIRGPVPNISWQFRGKKNSFDFWLKSLMLALANLWVFIKWYIGLNLDHFCEQSIEADQGTSQQHFWQFWGKKIPSIFD
jgi:hypothetical protein